MIRTILISLAVTVSAVALPPSAIAETGGPSTLVEILDEATSAHCDEPAITSGFVSGSCPLHAVGAGVEMHGHSIFGETLAARCDSELTGAFGEDGEGVIGANQIVFPPSSAGSSVDCTGDTALRPCDAGDATNLGHPGAENWHIEVVEDHVTGRGWMNVAICLDEAAVVDDVYGHLWMEMTGGNHPTGAEAEDLRLREVEGVASGVDLEFTGHWSLEASTVELVH